MSSKKSPPEPPQPGPQKQAAGVAFVLRTGLSMAALQKKFLALFPRRSLTRGLAGKVFYQRAFTPLITLWYLVFQQLNADPTLAAVLEDALAGGADHLSPSGKRLSKTLRSTSTASWTAARQRLPLATVRQALAASGRAIRATVANRRWHGLEPVLLDGTTYRLRPLGDIPKEFPPHHSGNNAQPYWCLARAVAAFCLATGVVLDSVVGAVKRSEQALTLDLLRLSHWANALFVADRNFGVYSVVRGVAAANAQILVRLTEVRARKLAAEAQAKLHDGLDQLIHWKPTRRDQCPEPLSQEPVAGRLIAVRVSPRGFRAFTLYLFTTLVDRQITVAQWVQLYGQRWLVELNLRSVKTQLHLDALACKSAELARKIWLAGLLAYNLVRAVMGMAAAISQQSALSLGFSRSLKSLRQWLPRIGKKGARQAWQKLLQRIARFTRPQRTKPRPHEPRAIRYWKSNFPKLTGDRSIARDNLLLANAKS